MNGWAIFGYYVLFIVLILLSLTIHETGHFVFGKIFKVNIKEYSIGIGPKYFSKINKKSNMKFSLRWLPLGAYVLFDSNKLREIYKVDKKDKNYKWIMKPTPKGKQKLDDISYWKQVLVLLGGIIFNLIFLIICWAFISNWVTLSELFSSIDKLFEGLWLNFTLQGSGDAFKQMPSIAGNGNGVFLNIIVLLVSINFSFAVFNFLPIPPLDGYRIVELTFSKLFRRKISDKYETIVTLIGIALILWLFIASIICDVK